VNRSTIGSTCSVDRHQLNTNNLLFNIAYAAAFQMAHSIRTALA
jgi:hypothetical protein